MNLKSISPPDQISPFRLSIAPDYVAELNKIALPDQPDELQRRQEASESLLAFTQYTFPNYKADKFHKHLAEALTRIVMRAKEGKSSSLMLWAPPQHGKLCAHSTPVLTSKGWRTHGDLRPGDYVYGRYGQPVRVIAISEQGIADREVEFSDHSAIRCHAKHEWSVFDRSMSSEHRHRPFIWETDALREHGLIYGKRGNRGSRSVFQLDAPVGIKGRHRDLPVDPYVLGVWLGDGTESKNCVVYHPSNRAIVDRMARHGMLLTAGSTHSETGCETGYFRELYGQLNSAGLLGNKHIPDAYFTSSIEQRLQLLAGLIDTDGYVYPRNGRTVFSTGNDRLVRDVSRLIATLGWRVTHSWAEPAISSSGIRGRQPVCQITFNPTVDIPVELGRKKNPKIEPIERRRSIVDIRDIPPEPGRCIQVEGGIYLAGDRLIPTHNSELVSTRLPSFWLAHNTELPVAMVSYAASLAKRNSRYARSVMDSPFYQEIFPGIMPDEKNWRIEDWHVKNRKGYAMAVGVGGPITGHGFGLGLIDDPIENWAAAQSETLRETIWQWWLGTFRTRLWEGASIIFMMTRWHEDDLAGRILDQEGTVEEGGEWEVLSYPALAEDPETDPLGRKVGEPLAPSRYSRNWLVNFRDKSVEQVWQAEYQQHPVPPSGDFFKVGRIELVEAIPAELGRVIRGVPVALTGGARYWDLAGTERKTAKREPDSTSGSLMNQHVGLYYWLDNINVQYGPDRVEQIIKQTANLDGDRVRIRIEQEPGQSGKAQIAHYVTLLAGFDVEGIPSSGDKMVRAAAFAAQVNSGNVRMLKAPWNKKVLAVLANFPHGREDDDVDSGAGAFNSLDLEGKKWRKQGFASV
jgi:predicted phage terminase large subunit-like protein